MRQRHSKWSGEENGYVCELSNKQPSDSMKFQAQSRQLVSVAEYVSCRARSRRKSGEAHISEQYNGQGPSEVPGHARTFIALFQCQWRLPGPVCVDDGTLTYKTLQSSLACGSCILYMTASDRLALRSRVLTVSRALLNEDIHCR